MVGPAWQAARQREKSSGLSIAAGQGKNFEIISFHFVSIMVTICSVDEQNFLGTEG